MLGSDLTYSTQYYAPFSLKDIKIQNTLEKILAASGVTIAVFVIPIVFSFIYGGAVLSLSLQEPNRGIDFQGTTQLTSIEITSLRDEYSSSDAIAAQVLVRDPGFSCGDLYMTIYDISSAQRKAVAQGAFFDQCYDSSGTLPVGDQFSQRVDTAGQYLLEVQMFDQSGDKFLTASQKFSVR
ncbi:hypothetical protein C4565_09200 [Candidatus Parcubacteria bacterium]|nr:MAG: hypothetical protein C4565_09200 [Candidatus Parcubacteria bacterium]